MALAAALALLVAGTLWAFRPRSVTQLAEDAPAPTPPASNVSAPMPQPPNVVRPSDAPVLVALTLAPGSVRGSSNGEILIIPSGTERVRLDLESDPAAAPLVRPRASVRTVAGPTVWQGAAITLSQARTAPTARLEIPAAALPPDDYIVILFASGSDNREAERDRYFLRVRAP